MNTDKISKLINELSNGYHFDIRFFIIKNRIYIKVSDHNYLLQNTDYYYKGDLSFIHFTNIFALQDIIRQKKIRLYNLHNLNDPQELSYAFQYVSSQKKIFENARTNIYTFSMCKKTILQNKIYSKDEFNLWRLYGDNGKGVAIEFRIINEPKKWTGYHLSNVYYSREKLDQLKDIYKKISAIAGEKFKIVLDLGKLLCFNKSSLFESEKEVRILYDAREFNNLEKEELCDLNEEIFKIPKYKFDLTSLLNNKYFVRYIELPLYPEVANDKMPLLRIDNIYLGYKYDLSNIPYLALDEYKFNLKQELGYLPTITSSGLINYFNNMNK